MEAGKEVSRCHLLGLLLEPIWGLGYPHEVFGSPALSPYLRLDLSGFLLDLGTFCVTEFGAASVIDDALIGSHLRFFPLDLRDQRF